MFLDIYLVEHRLVYKFSACSPISVSTFLPGGSTPSHIPCRHPMKIRKQIRPTCLTTLSAKSVKLHMSMIISGFFTNNNFIHDDVIGSVIKDDIKLKAQ